MFRAETAKRQASMLDFQVKRTENMTKKVIRGKSTTNKVPQMFLDAKVFAKR